MRAKLVGMADDVRSTEQAGTSGVELSVVVPTYREAENLGHLIPRVCEVLRGRDISHEIIVVDDNSRDGTDEVMARLQSEGHAARVITRVGERGLSSAVMRGFDEARGVYLLCMDADLSHPPAALPALLDALKSPGVDFVIGSRYVPGGGTDADWGLFRWLNSKGATLLARPFTAARDPLAGFFALRRETYASAEKLSPIGYKIGLELIVKCRCQRIREVPIQFADRQYGETKLNLREQLRYVQHLLRLAVFKLGAWWRRARRGEHNDR
jgi:dolichol-phosphate mannosyltransferase